MYMLVFKGSFTVITTQYSLVGLTSFLSVCCLKPSQPIYFTHSLISILFYKGIALHFVSLLSRFLLLKVFYILIYMHLYPQKESLLAFYWYFWSSYQDYFKFSIDWPIAKTVQFHKSSRTCFRGSSQLTSTRKFLLPNKRTWYDNS